MVDVETVRITSLCVISSDSSQACSAKRPCFTPGSRLVGQNHHLNKPSMAERVESSSDMVANTPDSKARSRCPGSETTDGDLPQQDQQEQQRSRRGTSSSINQQEPQRERSDVAAAEPPSERQVVPPEQFSVFTVNEKKAIILTGSLAGFFSPLSSSIYFPDLNTIAAALHVSASQINLTVTTYLVRVPPRWTVSTLTGRTG